MLRFIVLLISLLVLNSCNQSTAKKDVVINNSALDSAMVVSAHPLASKIGKEILLKGGNAIDAAVAVQFALAVVHPSAGNIGGGGFMVLRLADGSSYSLDYRETAPEKATSNMYLDKLGNVVEGLSLNGSLAVGVPGTVDGMCEAHQKFGLLSWQELVQPAVALAENGFLLTQLEAEGLNYYNTKKAKFNSVEPQFFTKKKWQFGDTLFLKDLAHTLTLIRDHKRAGFYQGETANKIVDEMNRSSGLISFEDLANYKSKWRDPIIGTYKDYKLISMGPPSSGGVCLMQMLKMLESYDLTAMGLHSKSAIHLMVEAEKRAFADRSKYLGDPDFCEVPLASLLDSNYLQSRFADFDSSKASLSSTIYPGELNWTESDQTTHYSIVDSYGNAVSVTTTLNSAYGSGVVVGGAGFLLNNEMDDFSAKPGVPNLYGLIGGQANAIAPKKRMLSSMTPTILEKNGALFMVVGTPGGSTIITGVLQTILNVLAFNLPIDVAVSKGRFHHQWMPDEIKIEAHLFDSVVVQELRNMGHNFKYVNSMNRVDAILVNQNGIIEGGADPRGDDSAMGF